MKQYAVDIVCRAYNSEPARIREPKLPDRQNDKEVRKMLSYWYTQRAGLSAVEVETLLGIPKNKVYEGIAAIKSFIFVGDKKIINLIELLEQRYGRD